MNIETALEMIEQTGMVFNLGQFEPETLKQLNKLTRKGELARIKTGWPWQHCWTVRKTAYCRPSEAIFYQTP